MGSFLTSNLSHVLLTAAGLLCKGLAHYMLFPVRFLHSVLVHHKPLLKKGGNHDYFICAQEEKEATEDEMVRWQHLNGHEFEQTPGDSEGQGSLACCSSWGHK